MSHSIDIQFANNYIAGEPVTPRAVNNEPHDVFGDSLFTPPHDHQVGICQPTPNGTKYWVPKVINKPVEGTVFDTLELALNAYKEYAREGGFEVRKGGQKNSKSGGKNSKDEPNNKYFYCVRQGFKPPPNDGNPNSYKPQTTNPLGVTKVIKRRKRASCRCGCTAKLRLKKLPDGTYSVSKFIEKHNHSLDEIFESLFHCFSLSVQDDDTSLTYMIRDIEVDYTTIHGVSVETKYEVTYVPASCDIKCSCLKYEFYGLLCRHIFYVLRMSKVFHFPRKYLQRRWSKYALPNKIVTRPVDVASLSNPAECVNGVLREIYGTVEDSDDLDTLLEQVKIDIPNAPEMSKTELYAAALGVTEPMEVNIIAPECHNKGSVSVKRHQTQAEKAIIQSKKTPRKCNACGEIGYHDSRNCPTKKNQMMKSWTTKQ
ncbi:FAR1 DNA binding domain-containing protein [Artemisia annua]|uniref:FAR1 DNA binding domain-containing protein n=1 Tax=Artemisia annua TaxID=35608 RepID=A0A2U1MP35_ARTAN|nr:FAR1 DNA binding domain-containing protein [Artemisia annua]